MDRNTEVNLKRSGFDCHIEEGRLSQLRFALKHVSLEGEILEFGVFQGKSISTIAREVKDRTVCGFNSFVGLPEDWQRSNKRVYPKEHFKSKMPTVPKNVELIKGFFDKSLNYVVTYHEHHSLLL